MCGYSSPLISGNLGVCAKCIKEKPDEALSVVNLARKRTREIFNLPPSPPRSLGTACGMCANKCVLGQGEKGFCGLTKNVAGRLMRLGGTSDKGILEWYYDALPTNCVAWWFCPGCTGAGYPKYTYKPSAEIGYVNLAVFYGACSLDCLFCQNWHYRYMSQKLSPHMSSEELADKVNAKVSCICFFGGDPSVQMPHAIKTSEIAMGKAEEESRILRICWETNGNMIKEFAKKAADLSFKSGGIVKFDLKAWDENLYRALCGVSNKPPFENFMTIGEKYFSGRLEVPVLTASTLLIPGYVDVGEIKQIAEFIANIDPRIPYTLLAFYPQYLMDDLPTTTRKHAYECYETAKKHLKNVRIGNVHLLS
ncbi:radical SAM protein [Candidatus Bathyarchaeota archaeon]|nr:radical SAM protein [Candidatus Bathyarchaeota archaeon]